MDANLTYKDSGVDIDAGNEAVKLMKEHVRKTWRPEVLTDLGNFAGLFALDIKKYTKPVLVSGTDGVGTKLKLAFLCDKHDTIGIDAVAMCVNDILVLGAEPLFFLDYLAVGKLLPEKVADIVKGVAEGCMQAGCALIGGETAEMPGFYKDGEYDVAGFSVGVVDKDKAIDGSKIKSGDKIIGIASSGIHSNGFSLARKVLLEKSGWEPDTYVDELKSTIGHAMLTPTRIYVKAVLKVIEQVEVLGMAHITGGGLVENLPRVFASTLDAVINTSSWDVSQIFKLISKIGNVSSDEMFRVFNMGIGYCMIVSPENVDKTLEVLREQGEVAYVIGEMTEGNGSVSLVKGE